MLYFSSEIFLILFSSARRGKAKIIKEDNMWTMSVVSLVRRMGLNNRLGETPVHMIGIFSEMFSK